MEIVTQLALFLENRPGTLAAVCDALASEKINILALTVSDTVDHSVVRLIVSDPQRALAIFEERGTLVVENEVLLFEEDNKPGKLSEILKKLGAKKINVEYAYVGSPKSSRKGSLVIRPNNIQKAFDALS